VHWVLLVHIVHVDSWEQVVHLEQEVHPVQLLQLVQPLQAVQLVQLVQSSSRRPPLGSGRGDRLFRGST
jgi:hypothetical protein